MTAGKKPRIRLLLAVHTRELKTAFFLALSERSALQIVASATNTAELLSYSRAFQPDAIALEWEMPGRLMADVLPVLIQSCTSAEVLIICRPSSLQQIRDVAPSAQVFDDPEALINKLEALKRRKLAQSSPSQTKEDSKP